MEFGLIDKITQALNKRANDDKFLAKIYNTIEEYDKEELCYFDTNGNSLSKEQLSKKVIEATNRVKNGNYLTTEQLKKRLDNWSNA